MGRYHPSMLQQLTQYILVLKNNPCSTNPERLFLIEMLFQLSKHVKNPSVLTGALIYCLEKIAGEKILPSWNYIFKTGSNTSVALKKGLNLTPDNPLNDQERFVYLMDFYHFIKQQQCKFKHPSGKEIEIIDDVIQTSGIVIKRLEPDIDAVLRRPLLERVFLESFAILPDAYEKIYDDYHAKSRKQFSDFVRAFEILRQADKKETDTCHYLRHDIAVRYGILLYMMLHIENQYRWIRYPSNSVFYRQCQKALNIEHSNDIKNTDKRAYLSAFYTFISVELSEIKRDKHANKVWEAQGLQSPDSFFKKLEEHLWEQITFCREQIKNGIDNPKLNSAFNGAIHAIDKYALNGVIAGVQWRTLSYIIAPEYAMVMTLALMVHNPFKEYVVDTIAEYIDPYFKKTLKKSAQLAYQNLVKKAKYAEDDLAWHQALYDAPDSLLPKEQKAKLASIVSLQQETGEPDVFYEEKPMEIYSSHLKMSS